MSPYTYILAIQPAVCRCAYSQNHSLKYCFSSGFIYFLNRLGRQRAGAYPSCHGTTVIL